MITSQSFKEIVFCNFCHDFPAVGWLEVETEEGKAARAACRACAEKQGGTMLMEVLDSGNST